MTIVSTRLCACSLKAAAVGAAFSGPRAWGRMTGPLSMLPNTHPPPQGAYPPSYASQPPSPCWCFLYRWSLGALETLSVARPKEEFNTNNPPPPPPTTTTTTITQLYALVSRGRDVLAEFTAASGNFPTVTRIILGKIPSDTDGRMSYVYDQCVRGGTRFTGRGLVAVGGTGCRFRGACVDQRNGELRDMGL